MIPGGRRQPSRNPGRGFAESRAGLSWGVSATREPRPASCHGKSLHPRLRLHLRIPLGAPAALALVLALVACSRQPQGLPVASFDMTDLQVPPMFQRLASGLARPYVLELPDRSVNERFSVHLGKTTEREVLDVLVARDATFQYRMDGGADVMWPKGEEEAKSPWSKPVPATKWEGGVGEATRQLMLAAGLTDGELRADKVAVRRPVTIDLAAGTTLRDALALMAAQAKLAVLLDGRTANVTRIETGVSGALAPDGGQGPLTTPDMSPDVPRR